MSLSYFHVRIRSSPSHGASIKLSSTIAWKIKAPVSAGVFINSRYKRTKKKTSSKPNEKAALSGGTGKQSESPQSCIRSSNSSFVRGLLLANITLKVCCFSPCVYTSTAPGNCYPRSCPENNSMRCYIGLYNAFNEKRNAIKTPTRKTITEINPNQTKQPHLPAASFESSFYLQGKSLCFELILRVEQETQPVPVLPKRGRRKETSG